jgi:hypothetical protein
MLQNERRGRTRSPPEERSLPIPRGFRVDVYEFGLEIVRVGTLHLA